MKRNKETGFKINFNILDYSDILPDTPENIQEIINWDKPAAQSVWKRIVPNDITPEYIQQEMTRVLRTGVWIFINLQPIWLPPNYYFFLQYGIAGDEAPQFRLKRLKHVYFKLRVRNNPSAIGTYTIKNRQDGETTSAIHDALWECLDGNLLIGQLGIQSKTNEDAQNPCWLTMQTLWQVLPHWFKKVFFSDFESEGAMERKMVFKRESSESKKARNIRIAYYPAVYNAMDGKNNMRRCILDEVNKWMVCSFYDTYINYKKFIAVGASRRGLFDIFSSPADKNGVWNDEALKFWKGSNPDEITETGATATRVYRYHSNPLDGIEGFYDEFGDADPDEILAFIKTERANTDPDKLMGEIRAFPLNEDEMFGATDGSELFSNTKGIKERVLFLIGRRFKDENKLEPINIYGIHERVNNYIDADVVFRPSGKSEFNLVDSRFCYSFLPQNKVELKRIFEPPSYVERVIGLDPSNLRYDAKNKASQSNLAMVGRQFRDVHETGVLNVPFMTYCCRTQHQETMFEDCLMAAIFNRALIQYESRSDKFANYAEDRGYSKWLLPEMGESADSKRKGDAPSGGGKNAFLNTGISLIDSNTNIPITPEDPYWLENHWHLNLLQDYLKLNPVDTHKNDLSMADIQALVGQIKIMYKKVREKSRFNDLALSYYN